MSDGKPFAGGCAWDGFAITPNSSADLAEVARGLYVGGAGNVKVTTAGGTVLTFVGVPAGVTIPWFIKRVWGSPDTTATSIIGGSDTID